MVQLCTDLVRDERLDRPQVSDLNPPQPQPAQLLPDKILKLTKLLSELPKHLSAGKVDQT